MVTPPVLAMAPAAMVSVLPCWRKSPATAGATGSVVTRRTVSTPARWSSDAVTAALAPSSRMAAGDSTSAAFGTGSSSVMVSSRSAGVRPRAPSTLPVTRTVFGGEARLLPTVVMVTVPLLAESPAPMVSSRLALKVKSAAAAGATGAASTVIVNGSLTGGSMVAVTVAVAASSLTSAGSSTSVTSGPTSSSSMVRVTGSGAATPAWPATAAVTRTCLSPRKESSSTPAMVTLPVLAVCPAAMISEFPLCANSVSSAGGTASAVTVSVSSSLVERSSTAVTAAEPLCSSIGLGSSRSDTTGGESSSRISSTTPRGPFTPDAFRATPRTFT